MERNPMDWFLPHFQTVSSYLAILFTRMLEVITSANNKYFGLFDISQREPLGTTTGDRKEEA
jgi:hypothetical protein